LTTVIIPSRYASERLPAKPLAMIRGKTLVERVYRQCSLGKGVDRIYVATDHAEIAREVERFGGTVAMTSPDCASGTDRVAQAAERLGITDGVVINVQGDEPLIDPTVITSLALLMQKNPDVQIATPVSRLTCSEDLTNPNIVKVVMNEHWNALYFSRQAIPYLRDMGAQAMDRWVDAHSFFKHIGVYAYRIKALKQFVAMKESPLERAEHLEQLRLLEAGIPIRCIEVEYESVAIDTPEDIRKVESLIAERGLA
jgi:3-deoxy-manno-octulosonate cytidylyltransferase (CMP-KDO synthetase)